MIIPKILNKNFEKIGEIDDYISLIWASRYYECGDFEIVMPIDSDHNQLLLEDYYVIRDDDKKVGIIENTYKELDEDEKEHLIIKGRFAESILARRIIATQTQLYGSISVGVANLINDAIINPSDPKRKISNFIIKPTNFNEKLEAQITGKNLLTAISDIVKSFMIGFNVSLINNKFVFELYKGVDRSYNQSSNPWIIFSDKNDNLISSNYARVKSTKITDVLVAGEGEGLDRKMIWASKEDLSGLDRYEYFHDQRNMSSNDGNLTVDEYYNQMKEEGLEQITAITESFDGTVFFDNFEYRKDVYLGDIVVIENQKWGMFINTRLIEVIESVDEAGVYSIVPTFGI